jgi:hypothetical protein
VQEGPTISWKADSAEEVAECWTSPPEVRGKPAMARLASLPALARQDDRFL